ncbi:777_t:CDS:2, partial [Rhizophagus irregularis]
LRQLLLTQRVTSLARWSSSHRNNRRTRLSYRKSYAFHHILKDDSGTLSARTLISYSAHKSISHPSKKQLARQERHKDLLSDWSKFSRHVIQPDLLDSSMWMATKDHAIVIPLTSYHLTMSTTDYSIVQNIRNLVSSRPDVSFCLNERSHHSSVAFVSSKFTGSIQKVVLNPSSVVGSHFITDKPTSGPFVGLNCPVIDYQDFKTLGFSRSIIDMYNTSSVSKKYLRDAIQSIITKSASSSTFSHLWNSDTRFSFKLGRVKPCDILMLLDVCAPWFDSHLYPAPSDF